jgi:hypothetical protein
MMRQDLKKHLALKDVFPKKTIYRTGFEAVQKDLDKQRDKTREIKATTGFSQECRPFAVVSSGHFTHGNLSRALRSPGRGQVV